MQENSIFSSRLKMFRRSRFSARPNVGTAGRTAAPQEPPAANQETSKTKKEPNESSNASLANNSDVTPSENAPGTGDGNDQSGEGTSSAASVQRRKRFSIKPKVAPGRPPTLSRTPKSPVKAVSVTPVDGVSELDLEQPSTSSTTVKTPTPQGLQSPRRRRLSEDTKPHKIQQKVTPEKRGPSTVSLSEDSPNQTLNLPTDSSKQVENISASQTKEIHSRTHERVPPSLPDKEATEISEKAKTLISSKTVISITPSALSLSRLLNDPSDVRRMMKAQKLRELLRQERCKETKLKRAKAHKKEFTLDPTKMTMRDLIHYLPTSNPMTSSLEEHDEENETVIPPSPIREESTERAPVPEVPPIKVNSREEVEEEEAAAEEEQEEALMVPQVKVAEDGSLIIDEESLTVEVQRAKGPNTASDRDPIFERGSTTTYSSFRKSSYSRPWSIEETDMFYLAVSMVGTDFSMICQLFPHRARSEIKNKFKKEERINSWRIDKAFRERRKLDIEYFSKLLEKILEFQKERKKLKSLVKKNSKMTSRTKAKGKKSAKNLSDVEEEDEDEVHDLEEGQEKENEDQCNEGETPASELKNKRKRKTKVEALTEEPNEKKNKTGEAPEDSEAALPESHTNSEMSEKISNVNSAKETGIKPAKLSRAIAPKPLLPLGLKRGRKGKNEETESDKGDKNTSDEAHKEQINQDESEASRGKSAGDDISSEEEEATVKHRGPTRYGRVPKQTAAFAYACKEQSHSSVAETTSASPSTSKSKPKCTVKRGKSLKPQSDKTPKKAKLVTLRSLNSDFSDEDDEEGQDPCCSSSQDMSGFVPGGLHSLNAVISEVDDPMVELDILASMPDMLGISQDALCPDSPSHQAQYETGTAEACDHQLDLLVDVIDFFTSEETEVSQDESYNEAAQTLLTIGNVSHVSQSTQGEVNAQGSNSGTAVDDKTSDHFDEKVRDQQGTPASLPTACPQKVRDISETVASMDPQNSEMSVSDSSHVKTSEQMCDKQKTVHEEESGSHLKSKPQIPSNNSPSTKTLCLSKVNPKPNIGTAPPTSQTKTSKEQKAEVGHSVAPIEVTSAVKEAAPNRTESDEALLEDGDSLKEDLLKEEKSVSSLITQGCSVSLSQIESSRNETARDTDSSDYKDVSVIPHDGPGKTYLSSSLKSKSELTQVVQEPHTLSDSFQGGNIQHPPPENDLPVNQRNMGAVAARRSRLSKVKPNLPHMSRVALNKSQISKETVKKDPLTTSNSESQEQTIKDVQTPSTSFNLIEDSPAGEVIKILIEEAPKVQSNTEPQAEQASNAELAAAPGESSSPATLITPVEDRQADLLASNVSSASQLRRSHLQKVKPKPNLTQALRAKKTKPQSTENTAIKSPGPNPESLTKSTAEVFLQAVCSSTSDQQIAATGCALSLNPILDSDSTHVSTKKQSTNQEVKIPTELANQVEMEAASDQSATGNQNLTEVPVEQSKKQTTSDSGSVSKFTDKDSVSQNEMIESRCNDTMTSHVSPTCFDSDPVQDQRSQPAVFVRAEEESTVRKHDCETTDAGQPRRNRLSKIKPRPNIPQTSRATKFKSQTLENQSEKQTNPEQTVTELEPKTCGLSSEKQSVNTNPPSGLTPPLTSGSHARPSKMKTTDTDDQTSMNAAASETEKQNSNVNLELSEEQSTKEQESTSNGFPVASSLSISNNQALTAPTDNEPQFGQGSNLNSGTDLERSDQPAACKTALEELQVGQKEDKSARHFKRSQSLKPTPNLSQTSRLARSKGDIKSQVPPKLCVQQTVIEKEMNTEFTDEPLTPEVRASQSINVAPTVDSASTGSQEGTVSNICASVQDQTKPHAASLLVSEKKDEQSKTENSTAMQFVKKTPSPASEEKRKTEEKANVGHVSSSVLTEKTMPERRQRFPKVKPKPNVESSCRVTVKKLQSEDHNKPLEDQIKDISSTVMLEQQLESTMDTMSNNDQADPDSLSSGDCTLEMPVTVYSSNAQTVGAQTPITDVPSTSNASPSPHERDVSVQGDPTPSELIDSSKNSGKAPQVGRGRLIKPKPNLRCSSRLQQTQAVKNTKPTEADSGNTSQALSACGDLKLVSELGACTQEPEKDSSSNDAHSSHYCVKQGSSNEHETSSAEEIQRDLLLSEFLPEQVPSDPDEPFFILSLTEVPVSSAEEVETSPAESLSYLPATGASGQQSSVSDVSLEAEDHPELSVEPKVFNTTIAEPNKTNHDDYAEKKSRLSCKNKVSASDFSEANIVKTRDPPCKKTASKRNEKKLSSEATQMSSSEPKVSTSNYIIPTQTKSATEAVTQSVSLPVGPRSVSTVLTSPEGESRFADEEPTSVSRYFLTDIFTEVED
ncbi:transcription factor TFIIIB component B'' homolog isoform X2 [Girardinichthys multiradiatus]|uniref:transcription factor TFIIIB component B'' homolog isoform X2 n=1 Tax=Girardinichthys multiradiatus TaxID=208333 RepID=UPI001FAB3A56|nr:transcription factor TFIIIB component B'' homolog isoform X2 [Girardinichthys multiradiatus]